MVRIEKYEWVSDQALKNVWVLLSSLCSVKLLYEKLCSQTKPDYLCGTEAVVFSLCDLFTMCETQISNRVQFLYRFLRVDTSSITQAVCNRTSEISHRLGAELP